MCVCLGVLCMKCEYVCVEAGDGVGGRRLGLDQGLVVQSIVSLTS